jgi:hypothetical protein
MSDLRFFLRRVILATPAGVIIHLTFAPPIPAVPLPKEGAMTERDLTEREDRLLIFWLTAMAIVLVFVFVFILSTP